MPLYMTQVGYTSEAVAALTRNPEDHSDVFWQVGRDHVVFDAPVAGVAPGTAVVLQVP